MLAALTPIPSFGMNAAAPVTPPLREELPASGSHVPQGWYNFADLRDQIIQSSDSADDTEVLQRAIDLLSSSEFITPVDPATGKASGPVAEQNRNTLFLPAGTYRISKTLTVRAAGVRIIGEDPQTTKIVWAGKEYTSDADPVDGDMQSLDGSWMFRLNGANHAQLSRLTLDGGGRAEAAIRVGFDPHNWTDTWKRTRTTPSATGFRLQDLVLENVARGIWAGINSPNLGGQSLDSEGFVSRTVFRNIGTDVAGSPSYRQAGLVLDGANTLNWQVWDSTFESCDTGLSTNAGTFAAWDNLFSKSRATDIALAGHTDSTVRGNTSIESRQFVRTGGPDDGTVTPEMPGGGPAEREITIMDNTVLDPSSVAVDIRGNGGTVITDNRFRTSIVPIREQRSLGDPTKVNPSELIIGGNQFSLPSTSWWDLYKLSTSDPANLLQFDNSQTDLSSVSPAAMPPTPHADPSRTIREIAPAATADDIQAEVNSLASLAGERPIIHIPAGHYIFNHPVVIPAGLDVQLIGDGEGTFIQWAMASDDFLFRVQAPARATIRDMRLGGQLAHIPAAGEAGGKGISVQTNDLDGDRVYLTQVDVSAANSGQAVFRKDSWRALAVNQVDRTQVRMDGGSISDSNVGLSVSGGALAAQNGTTGVRWFGGSTSGTVNSAYELTSHGKLVAQTVESEGGLGIDLRGGSGSFTLAGSRYVVSNPCPAPSNCGSQFEAAWNDADQEFGSFKATGFQGDISMVNTHLHSLSLNRASAGASPTDRTFAFGVLYEYAPGTHGMWPNGAPNNFPAYVDCTPVLNAGGQSLSYGNRALLLQPHGWWPCAVAGSTSAVSAPTAYAKEMLKELRSAKPQYAARNSNTANSDMLIEHVTYGSLGSHMGIEVSKAASPVQ
ncbi:hypothetical protein KV205_35105 [Streptomyces sp. SKN60]|uniref:glycosyl hydrolase family 28-related protein n=1 Tax=Streptomyces sp. SKN60 TaxID=2855506 RepID=UPI0022455A74|nr:glycosyl hydrolase family 28-related protein [Streptomyces sp. SKN60]MCX2185698.1 hypothetical protein [Streptomyces sp. SKN60]